MFERTVNDQIHEVYYILRLRRVDIISNAKRNAKDKAKRHGKLNHVLMSDAKNVKMK